MQLTARFVLAAVLAFNFRSSFALPMEISDARSLDTRAVLPLDAEIDARALEDGSVVEERDFEELDARQHGGLHLQHTQHDLHRPSLSHGRFEEHIRPEVHHHPENHNLHFVPRQINDLDAEIDARALEDGSMIEERDFEELDARQHGGSHLQHTQHDLHRPSLSHGRFEEHIRPEVHHHPENHNLHFIPRQISDLDAEIDARALEDGSMVEERDFEELDARQHGGLHLQHTQHDLHRPSLSHGRFEEHIRPEIHHHPENHNLHFVPRQIREKELQNALKDDSPRMHPIPVGNGRSTGRLQPGSRQFHTGTKRVGMPPNSRGIRKPGFHTSNHAVLSKQEGRFQHGPLHHKQGLQSHRLNGASPRHGAGLRQLSPVFRDQNRRPSAR